MIRRFSCFLLLALAACVHPLGQSDVDRLTRCKGTDLKKIRKSLLLNGYEVKSETDSDLVTDWKQVAGYGGDRTLQKITVVKQDDGTFKFRVRLKSVRIEKQNDTGLTVVNRDRRSRPSNSITFDFSQPVEVENEEDLPYYEERIDSYEETQREVCGT